MRKVMRGAATMLAAAMLVMAGAAAVAEEQAPDAAVLHAQHMSELEAAARAMDAKLPGLSAEAQAVVAANRAFSDDAASRGLAEAFASRFAAEGRMFPPGAPVAEGPAAVRALMQGDLTAIWTPVDAIGSGTVAATWGIAAFRGTREGKPIAFQTRYVTVWRKNAEGAWEIWADLGPEAGSTIGLNYEKRY